ncbi:hypothetical protein TSUD_168440 [Trifolium subterraneum]|nr:hypothetical protein TSUD_168440 [Trifolium subterraneum]
MQHRDSIRHNQIWSDMLNASKYNMKKMYMAVPDGSPVMWRTLFYENLARPRALVNLWIACNERLATRDRETKSIWKKVLEWIQIDHNPLGWRLELEWII